MLASAKDKKAAKAIAEAFAPSTDASGSNRQAYLEKIAGGNSDGQGLKDLAELNKALRAGDENAPGVAKLDATMVALPDDVLLSRLVPASAFGATDPQSLEGMKVRDAGFAAAQLGTAPATQGAVRMRMAVPSGTKAVVNPATGEVVLDRDTEMVVAKVEPNAVGGHDMYLTVLPKAGAKSDGKTSGPTPTQPAEAVNADVPAGGDQVRADLMKLKVADLQSQMRDRGLKPGRKRKSELVDALVADEMGHESSSPAAPPVKTVPASVDDQVRSAVEGVIRGAGGQSGDLVSLAKVRDELGGLDRADVDAALLRLDRARVIQLEPDPHRIALSDRAKAAAIPLGGEDMHLVSLVVPVDNGDGTDLPAAPERDPLDAAPIDLYASPRPEALTNRMYRALNGYRDDEYTAVNGQLRGGPETPASTKQVAAIDDAMQASLLSRDVQVFRGLADARSMFGNRVDGDLTGLQWREDGYLSTSTDLGVANRFAEDGLRDGSPMLMQILVPAGTPGVGMSGPEAELLVDRGHTISVVRDRGVVDGVRQVDVQVGPKTTPPPGPVQVEPSSAWQAAQTGEEAFVLTSMIAQAARRLVADRKIRIRHTARVQQAAVSYGQDPRAGDLNYVTINAAIRGHAGGVDPAAPEAIRQTVTDLDLLLAAAPTRADTISYRGVQSPDAAFPGWRDNGSNVGLEWTAEGYQSTTTDEAVARDFAAGAMSGGVRATTPTVARVLIPKGTPGLQMSPMVSEILLPRNQRFQVVADRGIVDGVRQVDIELIPEGGTSA